MRAMCGGHRKPTCQQYGVLTLYGRTRVTGRCRGMLGLPSWHAAESRHQRHMRVVCVGVRVAWRLAALLAVLPRLGAESAGRRLRAVWQRVCVPEWENG